MCLSQSNEILPQHFVRYVNMKDRGIGELGMHHIIKADAPYISHALLDLEPLAQGNDTSV